MPNAFSRYCFREQQLEEALSHFTIKKGFNGCSALFGEPKCAKLLNWTDGNNAENVQVIIKFDAIDIQNLNLMRVHFL